MKESGMKSHISVALLVAALFVFSGAVHKSGDSGPFSIDLNQPGDALVLTLNGKHEDASAFTVQINRPLL